jgi:MinD-like ATPase involved in chromosome partitioning or flagellar assembly
MVKGQLIAIWGATGSPGKSSIALSVASELALAGQRVFLLDADNLSPSLNLLLGLTDHPAGVAAACRLVSQGRFDLEQLERLSVGLTTGRGEVLLMTGISDAERWPELSSDRVGVILEVAQASFDSVVVDLASSLEGGLRPGLGGPDRNELTREILARAEQVILVCAADPVGVHRFLLALQSLRQIALTGEVIAVVNRLRKSVLGAGAKQQLVETLSRLAQLNVAAFIPDDPTTADLAIRNSLPMAMGKRGSPAKQAIALLVRTHLLKTRSRLDERLAKLD